MLPWSRFLLALALPVNLDPQVGQTPFCWAVLPFLSLSMFPYTSYLSSYHCLSLPILSSTSIAPLQAPWPTVLRIFPSSAGVWLAWSLQPHSFVLLARLWLAMEEPCSENCLLPCNYRSSQGCSSGLCRNRELFPLLLWHIPVRVSLCLFV